MKEVVVVKGEARGAALTNCEEGNADETPRDQSLWWCSWGHILGFGVRLMVVLVVSSLWWFLWWSSWWGSW